MHFVLASAALSKLLLSVGFSCGPSAMSEVRSSSQSLSKRHQVNATPSTSESNSLGQVNL